MSGAPKRRMNGIHHRMNGIHNCEVAGFVQRSILDANDLCFSGSWPNRRRLTAQLPSGLEGKPTADIGAVAVDHSILSQGRSVAHVFQAVVLN